MKASDLFVRCLENEGITHIFGVPGEENADFMMSLENSSIEFVITRHEQGAAFMAAVYGRLTGNPAGCLGTLGPGATNLITGVADGNMDRAPMLVLTGQGSTDRLHKESHQIMDVVSMYRPVTKWAYQITNAEVLPEAVRKAVRTARAEKPGAVLLELPEDIAQEETDVLPMPVRRFRRPAPDPVVVDDAVHKILAAKRPIVLAGNGAVRKRSSAQLRRFCELTGIGVVSTFMGKGAVDMDSPQCLFTVGLQQKDEVSCALDASDLVICVGYDLVEYHPHLWNASADKAIVHLDFTPAEIDSHYNPTVELIGDIAHALDLVSDGLAGHAPFAFDLAQQRATRETMLAEFREHAEDDTEGSIRPQKVLWDLREELGPQDLLLSGVGAHKMWVGRMWNCHEPNTCIIPNGFCSMGLPLPGAIAAKIARPDAKVVGVVGDGDFLMNVQEMETARRLDADITMVVWEDHGYGLIAWKQENHFGRHTDLSFGNPDWLKLAEAFGWHGQLVENARDLRPALRAALEHRGPSLVVLPIDYRENRLLTERLGKIVCAI
jgi:acetolactate synthase-1/2/3 large subunit